MNMQQTGRMMTVAALAAVVAGCVTTGYDRASKMSSRMQKTQQDVRMARSQVTVTFDALSTLLKAEVGDLRPLLASYDRELSRLQTMSQTARSRAQEIPEAGAAYFQAWAQEIDVMQDPQLREVNLKRHADVREDYRKVEQALVEVRDGYLPVISALTDIQTSLHQDLTASGIASVKPTEQKARQEAIKLQQQMTTAGEVIDAVVRKLAPTAAR